MPRVSGGESSHERLAVAHLANHNHVRILAHYVNQGAFKTQGVEANLALFDDGLFVLKNVFDWIFERDDVAFLVLVDVLNHRGQRAGLATAGRAANQE